MPIDPTRIAADIDAIAAFSESTPSVGYSRPTFSAPWVQARDYVIAQAAAAGCKHRIDAAGNVHIRPASIGWDEKVWLSGSHIDSVPTGGKYDGVMGVVVPLEVLRGGPVPLELVIWAEEEGTTFGIGMIGSRLATGAITFATLAAFTNREGRTYSEAGADHGVRTNTDDRFRPSGYRGMVEVHAEQGPSMWDADIAIAFVTAIAGRKQFRVTFRGVPNHAGSTPMEGRKDALAAAARFILAVEGVAYEAGHGTVATVGQISCSPNAINVIPGTVTLTVDLRCPREQLLTLYGHRIDHHAHRCGVDEVELIQTEDQPPIPMDRAIVDAMVVANESRRFETTSGALHDAAVLAPLLPTAMLFVASQDGISHNPAEFSRIEDIAAAARVLDRLVRE